MQNIILGIQESFKEMDLWTQFTICFAISVIFCILFVIIFIYIRRSKKLKNHKIIVLMDGGIYQNSSNELILQSKVGVEVDISKIKPYKEGYSFNGFNIYRRYISSTVTSKGVIKQSVSREILDGVDKNVIIMPNYDIYLVAKYTPLIEDDVNVLIKHTYYDSFLTYEDLISELKHLNYNNDTFKQTINIYNSKTDKEFTYVFKQDTLFMMIRNYCGLNKVYLRTNKNEDELLLNNFFQIEDLNDSYSWYSFIVLYNTSMSLFLNLVKESYLLVDESLPTNKTELKLIVSSINLFSDPVLDRALLLTDNYLKENKNKSILNENNKEAGKEKVEEVNFSKVEEEVKDTKKEAELESNSKQEVNKNEDNELDYNTDDNKEVNEDSGSSNQVNEEIVDESYSNVEENSLNQDNQSVEEANLNQEIDNSSIENSEEVVSNTEDDQSLNHEDLNKDNKSLEEEKDTDNKNIQEVETIEVKDADGQVHVVENNLTDIEKEELNIKKTKLKFNKKSFVDFILENSCIDLEVKKRKTDNLPYSLNYKKSTYFMVYENRFGLVRVLVKLDKEVGDELVKLHHNFTKASFPITSNWYQFYLDDTFSYIDELKDIVIKSTSIK